MVKLIRSALAVAQRIPLDDVLVVVGVATGCAGLWILHPTAALVAAGLTLIWLGYHGKGAQNDR